MLALVCIKRPGRVEEKEKANVCRGYYTPADAWKHRVVGTRIQDMASRPVKYEFAWDQNEQNGQGRLVWWIDGRPVMKAPIPERTRPM